MVSRSDTDTRNRLTDDDRGQAFTLEALVGGMILLTAVLFAAQTYVLTPASTGGVDAGTQEVIDDQARDILRVTATDETNRSLSEWVRYWNASTIESTFAKAERLRVGYGDRPIPGAFGNRLETTFASQGYRYNVVVWYQTPSGQHKMVMKKQGSPADNAVTATYPVTLVDTDTLTGPDGSNVTLENASGKYYPVEDLAPSSHVFNVLEVRITVW
jgi:hypothetical protein